MSVDKTCNVNLTCIKGLFKCENSPDVCIILLVLLALNEAHKELIYRTFVFILARTSHSGSSVFLANILNNVFRKSYF